MLTLSDDHHLLSDASNNACEAVVHANGWDSVQLSFALIDHMIKQPTSCSFYPFLAMNRNKCHDFLWEPFTFPWQRFKIGWKNTRELLNEVCLRIITFDVCLCMRRLLFQFSAVFSDFRAFCYWFSVQFLVFHFLIVILILKKLIIFWNSFNFSEFPNHNHRFLFENVKFSRSMSSAPPGNCAVKQKYVSNCAWVVLSNAIGPINCAARSTEHDSKIRKNRFSGIFVWELCSNVVLNSSMEVSKSCVRNSSLALCWQKIYSLATFNLLLAIFDLFFAIFIICLLFHIFASIILVVILRKLSSSHHIFP